MFKLTGVVIDARPNPSNGATVGPMDRTYPWDRPYKYYHNNGEPEFGVVVGLRNLLDGHRSG
jgi:hypothetical protein